MAPRANMNDAKYVEPDSWLNQFGMKLHPEIQANRGVVAITARPPRSAPPGRRIPNVTTTTSQSRPVIGVAVELVNVPLVIPSITPPNPDVAPAMAKRAISLRAGAIPDVRAATSELRTARAARPELECWRLRIASVSTPNTKSSISTAVRGWPKSNVVSPKRLNFGCEYVHPSWPLLMSWIWNTVRSKANAIASDANASARMPSRRTGMAISAPRIAATRVPATAANAQLR